jgi:hypothetical protein
MRESEAKTDCPTDAKFRIETDTVGLARIIVTRQSHSELKPSRPRRHSGTPINLRERVLTIDHDSRISPRAPFERVLAVERAVVSDIQAFGYNPGDAEQATSDANHLAVWYLVRRDLYLNDQATAF